MQKNLIGDLLLPDSITSIGNSAFSDCGFTGNLKLPNNSADTVVQKQIFQKNPLSGTLFIPEYVTQICPDGSYSFSKTNFDTIVFHDGITIINGSVFKECKKLTGKLVLPANLQILSKDSLSGCSNLTGSVTIPDSVVSVGNSAFANRGIKTIYGPNNDDTTYKDQFISTDSSVSLVEAKKSTHYATSRQALCSYPVTLSYTSDEYPSIEKLFNRPINFVNNSDGVWSLDPAFDLPAVSGAPIGYWLGWSFTSGGLAIKNTTVISGRVLYPSTTTPIPMKGTGESVSKTYDGLPAYVKVEFDHPV